MRACRHLADLLAMVPPSRIELDPSVPQTDVTTTTLRRHGAPKRTQTPNLHVRSVALYPVELWKQIGLPREIRTPDPLNPNQMRYQTALQADKL